jgi:hypothetical protein
MWNFDFHACCRPYSFVTQSLRTRPVQGRLACSQCRGKVGLSALSDALMWCREQVRRWFIDRSGDRVQRSLLPDWEPCAVVGNRPGVRGQFRITGFPFRICFSSRIAHPSSQSACRQYVSRNTHSHVSNYLHSPTPHTHTPGVRFGFRWLDCKAIRFFVILALVSRHPLAWSLFLALTFTCHCFLLGSLSF